MDRYSVKLLSAAYHDLDEIYSYLAAELGAERTALRLVAQLEETILSLETMPSRGARRRIGAYARRGYRQIFVENFTVVYRIDEMEKQVIIIAIQYMKKLF